MVRSLEVVRSLQVEVRSPEVVRSRPAHSSRAWRRKLDEQTCDAERSHHQVPIATATKLISDLPARGTRESGRLGISVSPRGLS